MDVIYLNLNFLYVKLVDDLDIIEFNKDEFNKLYDEYCMRNAKVMNYYFTHYFFHL